MGKFGELPMRVWQPLMREIDAKGLEPVSLIKEAQEYGAEAILLNCGGFSAWYPSKLDCQRKNPHMKEDLFGKLVKAARESSMQVIARLDISKGFQDWYTEHPDWFAAGADGKPLSMWGLYETCFSGPYWQDRTFRMLEEILKNYDVDALFFNFFRIKQCYCPRCQAEVRLATGSDVPPVGEFSLKYHRWRQNALAKYAAKLIKFAHTLSPSVQVMVYHHLREGWNMVEMAKVVDLVTAQASNPLMGNPVDPQPKWTYWASEEAQLGRALKPYCAPVIINTYSAFFASRRTAQPPDRLVHDLMEVAAHGGTTVPALSGTFEQDDPRALPPLKKSGKFLNKNKNYYTDLISIAQVALVRSEDSALLGSDKGVSGGNPVSPGHIAEFRGFYELLVQARYPFDLLVEGNLQQADLSRYKVVILPAVCCLSEEEAGYLDQFVLNGGYLLVTADTATINKQGKMNDSVLLQVINRKLVDRLNVDGAYFTLASAEIGQALGGTTIMGVAGEFLNTIEGDDKGWHEDLKLIGPVRSNAPEFSELGRVSDNPGLLTRTWGKGNVTYLPWRIGALFHQCGLPDYARLFRYLMEIGIGKPPILTDAPASVEIVCYDLGSNRMKPARVVHFLNATALQGKTLAETIALPGFRVLVKGHYVTAESLVAGEEIPLDYEDGCTGFNLKSLQNFEAVVIS